MNNPFLNSPSVIVISALKTTKPKPVSASSPVGISIATREAFKSFNFSTMLLYGSRNSPLAPLPSIASTIIEQSLNRFISFTDENLLSETPLNLFS